MKGKGRVVGEEVGIGEMFPHQHGVFGVFSPIVYYVGRDPHVEVGLDPVQGPLFQHAVQEVVGMHPGYAQELHGSARVDHLPALCLEEEVELLLQPGEFFEFVHVI